MMRRSADGGVGRRLVPLALGLGAAVVTLAGFGLVGAPLSLGTLAFLPVMLGVGTDLPIQAAHPASTRTVLVAALAGAAGFAALALSPLPFVRHLGLALAAGVLVSALLALPFRRSSPRRGHGEERQLVTAAGRAPARKPAFVSRDAAEKERRLAGRGAGRRLAFVSRDTAEKERRLGQWWWLWLCPDGTPPGGGQAGAGPPGGAGVPPVKSSVS